MFWPLQSFAAVRVARCSPLRFGWSGQDPGHHRCERQEPSTDHQFLPVRDGGVRCGGGHTGRDQPHERQARNPRACPRRGREPPARPAENPTQSGDQHRDCQHQPCHGRYCGSRDCGPIPVPAWPVKHPTEGARRVQDRPRGHEEDVAAGCSSYTHPQNRQRPGRAPDLVRSRPRPEPPDHRPRLSANIRSRSTSGSCTQSAFPLRRAGSRASIRRSQLVQIRPAAWLKWSAPSPALSPSAGGACLPFRPLARTGDWAGRRPRMPCVPLGPLVVARSQHGPPVPL